MAKNNRLQFNRWRRTAWSGLGFAVGLWIAATAHAGGMPLLMPDDFSELHLVAWRVEPGTPDPANPLLEGNMPWDSGGVGIHGSVFKDPLSGRWKAYLVCTPPEETSAGWPQPWASQNAFKRRLCVYDSDDGINWTRPQLPGVPFGEHKNTNILFSLEQGTAAYSSIMIDPSNRETPYRMLVLREASLEGKPPGGGGYYGYESRDGYAWKLKGGPITEPMSGDLCFFYCVGREYFAYYRLGGKKQPTDFVPVYEDAPRRSIYRATSVDGNRWVRDESMMITADDLDHRDTQYMELVPLRVEGGYLGMVSIFHPITQTQNLRIAASHDGSHWWFPDRRPCLDNAPLGDYGGGMMWQSQNLIVQDNRLYVYYGGMEGPHRQISETGAPSLRVGFLEDVISQGRHFLPFNAALCRAYWHLGRTYALVASAGGPTAGVAVTKAQKLEGKSLWVNIITRPAKKTAPPGFDAGLMRVELLDSQDKPISGFELKDCEPLIGDHDSLQVKWTGGNRAPAGAQKAKFYLKRTFLYGFQFRG
jgi:hypothetical protein